MNETQLHSVICELFLNGDSGFPLDGDTDLLEEGICDSLGLVRLAQRIEQLAGVSIDDQDITRENMASMGAILAFVDRRRAGA
ncbi:MAG: acyl carrier protein [Polyangiaceae bacterium]|nr:acyl carrier protein [Polyangiaceae bacterium]